MGVTMPGRVGGEVSYPGGVGTYHGNLTRAAGTFLSELYLFYNISKCSKH